MTALVQERIVTRRIALAGCGAVGSALLRLIEDQRQHIAASHGVRLLPVAVLVRDLDAPRDIPGGTLITTDPAALLTARPDVLVEATGDVGVAGRLASAALLRGVPFITASKALIAAHGEALHEAAARAGSCIGFEAAVGGGVPMIRALAESLPHAGITGVRGVLNGTTNYLLDRLSAGMAMADALAEARRRGFAEADASRDLDGRDAADKLAILAWLAFGARPGTLPIARRGIEHRPELLVRTAAAAGCTVRLLAEAVATPGGGVAAGVQPMAVGPASPFAAVRNEDNLLEITTRHAATVCLAGPGAGGGPTAVSLLGDILRPVRIRVPAMPAATAVSLAPPHPVGRWLLGTDAASGSARSAIDQGALRVGLDARPLAASDPTVFLLDGATEAAARHVRRAVEAGGLSAVLLRVDEGTASLPMMPPCTMQGTAAMPAPRYAPAAAHPPG